MVTRAQVLSTLREVVDPEIGVNLVDLDMIREVQIEENRIQVRMVLTIPGCPLAQHLLTQVRGKLEAIAEGRAVDVQLVHDVWEPR
jgi:serine O-acetyltransferase